MNSKQVLRQEILTLLKHQKEEDRLGKSGQIRDRLFRDPDFVRSRTVLFYASFAGEVETFDMIRQAMKAGKQVGLPRVDVQRQELVFKRVVNLEEDLEYGPYNIRQPKDDAVGGVGLENPDMVIVPGVAFDRAHNRLGRGAGYYDRFFSSLSQRVPLVGLAFDFQILETLPVEDHDIPVKRVITNPVQF